jgi:threonine aldolase
LADALAARFSGSVDPETVLTNIVCARADRLPEGMLAALAAVGIRAGTIDPETVRFVTHKDVDDDDIARVLRALDELA